MIKKFIDEFKNTHRYKTYIRASSAEIRDFLKNNEFDITFQSFNKKVGCLGRTTGNKYTYDLVKLYSMLEPEEETKRRNSKNLKTLNYYGSKRRWREEWTILLQHCHQKGSTALVDIFGGSGFISLLGSSLDLFDKILLNEYNLLNYNYLRVLQDENLFKEFLQKLSEKNVLTSESHTLLKRELYNLESVHCYAGKGKKVQLQTVNVEKALNYFLVNHYSFNGQGGYVKRKSVQTKGLEESHELLQKCMLSNYYYKKILLHYINNPGALIVLDPPYLVNTRYQKESYFIEFSERKHRTLVQTLSSLDIKAKVILCGYKDGVNDLYSRYLNRSSQTWKCLRLKKGGRLGEEGKEHIWVNFEVDELLDTYPYLFEDAQPFEIIKKIEQNKNSDITHLLIQGENSQVLDKLRNEYEGKVDIVYIDPPYNTKKGQSYTDSFFKEEWITFMEERLEKVKPLMSANSVLFISISDNSLYELKLLCDKVFGRRNFITNIVWEKRETKMDSKYLSNQKEYILCYRKGVPDFKKRKSKEKYYKLEDEKGKYCLRNLDDSSLLYHKTLDYPIEAPDKSLIYAGKSKELFLERQSGKYKYRDWCWRISKKEFERRKANGDIVFKKLMVKNKYEWRIYSKRYFEDVRSSYPDIYKRNGTESGSVEVAKILGERLFHYAKPVELIKYLINLYDKKDSLVLDFFAGSGTTGQAVLELNQEDGGDRQFILCTNNENDICDQVTYPRLKTVLTGVREDGTRYSKRIKGNLDYYKLLKK